MPTPQAPGPSAKLDADSGPTTVTKTAQAAQNAFFSPAYPLLLPVILLVSNRLACRMVQHVDLWQILDWRNKGNR